MPRLLALLFLTCLTTTAALAQPVAGWRNDGSGIYPDATVVTEWSPDNNVLWKTPMPAWGNACPVVMGDRIFVTAEPFTLVCVDANTGAILWQRSHAYTDLVAPEEVPALEAAIEDGRDKLERMRRTQQRTRRVKQQLQDAPDDEALKSELAELEQTAAELREAAASYENAWYRLPDTHETNGYASATPVTDGRYVAAVFGNGVVACYDMDGNKQWALIVEKPTHVWGHSASPAICGERLLVHIKGVTCLDLATGEQIWQTAVPENWGSLALTTVQDTPLVITSRGDILRVSDGVAVARSLFSLDYNSPTVSGDVVYFAQHGGPAIKLGALDGDTLETQVLWHMTPHQERYYASPVIHNGRVYVYQQQGRFTAIDAQTGQSLYEQQLDLHGDVAYPSPALAGDLLLCSSDNGTTAVIRPGEGSAEVLAVNRLEPFRGSPVAVGNRLYIRGHSNLYCIGATQ